MGGYGKKVLSLRSGNLPINQSINQSLARLAEPTPDTSIFRLKGAEWPGFALWIGEGRQGHAAGRAVPALLGPFLPSKDPVNDGQPKRICLLGEDLVAFRDSEGRIGLVDEACPHRGSRPVLVELSIGPTLGVRQLAPQGCARAERVQ